jgi:hypothetical protein
MHEVTASAAHIRRNSSSCVLIGCLAEDRPWAVVIDSNQAHRSVMEEHIAMLEDALGVISECATCMPWMSFHAHRSQLLAAKALRAGRGEAASTRD